MTDDEIPQVLEGKPNVFISYSRDDLEFADQLNAILQLAGFDATLDREDIKAGESWQARLGELIQGADTVVFVLSPSSAKSDVCRWELEEAERLGKRILPVVCRPLEGASPPDLLAALNYIFFYPEPRKSGTGFAPALGELVAALNTDLTWLREHTRYLERATEWDNGGRNTNRLLFGADIEEAHQWLARRPKDAPEILPLHMEFIRASEEEATLRANAERQRLEEMATAQAERETALATAETALDEKEAAQLREIEASRKVVRRTRIGAMVALSLAAVSLVAGLFAFTQKQAADTAKVKWKALAQEIKQEYLALLAKSSIADVLSANATPGEILLDHHKEWKPLMAKGRNVFAAARDYHAGRVLAVGHDGFLVLKKSHSDEQGELLKRAFRWLEDGLEPREVVIASGHCEWVPTRSPNKLTENMLKKASIPVRTHDGVIDDTALKDAGILVIGNAWGNFSETEIDSIENFVKAGGGLMLVGLGWSWKDYSASPGYICKGRNTGQNTTAMNTYPMNVLGKRFGMRWSEKPLR